MRTLSRYLLALSAATLLVPSFAAAEDGQPTTPVRTPIVRESPRPSESPDVVPPGKPAPAQFCSRFTDATGKLGTDTTNTFNQLSNSFAERGTKISADFKSIEDKINLSRTNADGQRATKFSELESKATTTSQKAAVTAFEQAITAAVAARRAATDAADAAFKAGLLSATSARQAQLKAAATAYKTAVATALANAKASCAAGTSPDVVRTNLKTALSNALATLNAARKNAPLVGPNLDALKATRKAAVDKANADFKAAVNAALATLKTALGVTSSPSPSPTATP
jgi:hypothetical protein